MSVVTSYNCTALTGGAARALDSYAIATLVDSDRAFVAVGGRFLYFHYDADGTDAEDTTTHPFKVRPDDYGPGVWIEDEPSGGETDQSHQNQAFPAQDERITRDLIVGRNADVAGNLEAGSVAGTDEHTLVGGLAVSETDASRPAGSFNQAGAAKILEAKDSGVTTWYAADGGGQVDVPQAGGAAATEGLQYVDNTVSGFNRRRQYIGGMLRNVSEEDGCQNRTFLITWT